MLQKSKFSELVDGVLMTVFGQYAEHGIILLILIAIVLVYFVRRKMSGQTHAFAKLFNGTPLLYVILWFWILAGLLLVHVPLNRYASFVEEEKTELSRRAEEKTAHDLQQKAEAEKNTPEYVQNQLRGWLEQMGYSIRAVGAKGDLIFRLKITGDIDFDVSNMKPQPDILILEARVLAKPHVLKAMSRLPKQKLLKFLNEVNLELLRSGVETGMITKSDGSETSTYLRHQIPIEPDKRAIFLREILRFKTAIIIIELYYDKISDGYFN